jgi:hypothetical protein
MELFSMECAMRRGIRGALFALFSLAACSQRNDANFDLVRSRHSTLELVRYSESGQHTAQKDEARRLVDLHFAHAISKAEKAGVNPVMLQLLESMRELRQPVIAVRVANPTIESDSPVLRKHLARATRHTYRFIGGANGTVATVIPFETFVFGPPTARTGPTADVAWTIHETDLLYFGKGLSGLGPGLDTPPAQVPGIEIEMTIAFRFPDGRTAEVRGHGRPGYTVSVRKLLGVYTTEADILDELVRAAFADAARSLLKNG